MKQLSHVQLKDELRKAHNLVNKRHTNFRKELLKVIEVFQSNVPVFPYEVCFGLIKQVGEVGSRSACLSMLPFLKALVVKGFTNDDIIREILNLLISLKSMPKFEGVDDEIKVLEVLQHIVETKSIVLNKMAMTHSLLNILCSFDCANNKQLWLKSLSILHLLTSSFLLEAKSNPACQPILFHYINELLGCAKEAPPKWLIEHCQSSLFAAHLFQAMEDGYFRVNRQAFVGIFQPVFGYVSKRVTILLKGAVEQSAEKPNWQLTPELKIIILLRLGCRASWVTCYGFEILEHLIKEVLGDQCPRNVKFVGYEALNYLFTSSDWLNALLTSESVDLFNFLLTNLFNHFKNILSDQKGNQKFDLCLKERQQRVFLGGFDGGATDIYPETQIKLIIRVIEQITYCLMAVMTECYQVKFQEKFAETYPDRKDRIPLEKTYRLCAKTVFEIVKSVFAREMPQETLQSLLKICEKYINMGGVFSDSASCTLYVKLVCKHCLPSNWAQVSHRHVQINKMILSMANCLGNLLCTSCWTTVWRALENYTLYYNRYLLHKEELQNTRQSDVQILYKTMETIFTQSPKYSNNYLATLISSLVEVAFECLENGFNDEGRKIFAFERLEQLYKLNLFRLSVMWHELTSSLICISTSKAPSFRLMALNLLNIIIPVSIHYLHTHPESRLHPLETENYEQILLEPWVSLAECQFLQIRAELAVALHKTILDHGHILTIGWKSLLTVINRTNDLKSLQAIIETFLEKTQSCLNQILEAIGKIESSLSEANQKYLCLTLIWSVADFCHRSGNGTCLKSIYEMLSEPEEILLVGTEARHSSFYILAEILIHNCIETSEEFWEWIFCRIENYYLKAADRFSQQTIQSYEQPLSNLVVNLIKVYRRYFQVSKSWEQDNLTVPKLRSFFNFCGRLIRFRSAQIYMVIVKQCRQIVSLKPELAVTLPEYYNMLEGLASIYYAEDNPKIMKCLVTYLPTDIYELNSRARPSTPDQFKAMHRIFQKLLFLRIESEEKEVKLSKMRIFFDDKTFIECYKKVHARVFESDGPTLKHAFQSSYVNFIHRLCKLQDYISLVKILPFAAASQIGCGDYGSKMMLDVLVEILELRNQPAWVQKHGSNKEVPVWYVALQQLMKLISDSTNKPLMEQLFTALKTVVRVPVQDRILTAMSNENATLYEQVNPSVIVFLFQNFLLPQTLPSEDIEAFEMVKNLKANSASFNKNKLSLLSQSSLDALFKLSHNNSAIVNISLYDVVVKTLMERMRNAFENFVESMNPAQVNSPVKSDKKIIISPSKQEKAKDDNDIHLTEMYYILKRALSLQLHLNTLVRNQFSKAISPELVGCSFGHLFIFMPVLAKCINAVNPKIRQLLSQAFLIIDKQLECEPVKKQF